LYRRAYPEWRRFWTTTDDFRLAVKWTRPKTLAEAVTAALQEEYIRFTESRKLNPKMYPSQIYDARDVQTDKGNRVDKSRLASDKAIKKCFKCDSTQHLIRDCSQGGRRMKSKQSDWTGTVENQRTHQNVNPQLNRDRPRQ
jgi:hypothetical protein